MHTLRTSTFCVHCVVLRNSLPHCPTSALHSVHGFLICRPIGPCSWACKLTYLMQCKLQKQSSTWLSSNAEPQCCSHRLTGVCIPAQEGGLQIKSITLSHHVSIDAQCNLLIRIKWITGPKMCTALTWPTWISYLFILPYFFQFPDFSRFPGPSGNSDHGQKLSSTFFKPYVNWL